MNLRLLLLILLIPLAARAESYETAVAAYEEGAYMEAVEAGKRLATADGLALAARSLLAYGGYHRDADHRRQVLNDAIAAAEAALKLAPDHVEANLQWAIALGYRARLDVSMGDARRARQRIEMALAHDPENPWANAALAGWHGEVRDTLGGFIAGAVMGASKKKCFRAFDRALALDPENPAIRFWYAHILLRFDRRDRTGRAQELLQAGIALAPRTTFEASLQALSAHVLAALQTKDKKTLKQALADTMPFST